LNRHLKQNLAAAFGFVCTLTLLRAANSELLDKARELYRHTDYDAALAILDSISGKDRDAAVWYLTGEALFHKVQFKRAAGAFENAVSRDPSSSRYVHALGRAYGRIAEGANPLMAAHYAVKTRQAFEKAVELDAANQDALNDLLEYYLEAPALLGGGLNRADGLLARISQLDAAEGHYARAQIALKRKDISSAEREFRAAMNASPKQVGRILDLAEFLAAQGRTAESDRYYGDALKLAPSGPQALFARAQSYVRQNRNLGEAASLLEKYLTLSLTPDDPPQAAARALLHQARPRNAQSH
jgi:tetratricopeptide (TPR) repeat protein